jgi:hypothetical protein
VGIAALSSGPWHLALELLLARALQLRGAATELLMCDLPDLPICNERLSSSRSIDRCAGCLADKRALLEAAAVSWEGISALVERDAIAHARATVDQLSDTDLPSYAHDGWPLGQWLHVSACHFLRRDGSGNDAAQIDARRRLLASAIVTTMAAGRWLDRFRPTVVIVQGGVHFMWRIVFELAKARGIPVVCREMGKGGWDHHLYALNRDSMNPDLDQAWRVAMHEPLSAAEGAEVDRFLDQLASRTYVGAAPTMESPVPPRPDQRTLVAFTNVTWDMATAGRDVGFQGLSDWLRQTIRAVSALRDIRLIIRAHPAEVGNTNEPVMADLTQEWPDLADRVTLIPPGDRVSAAALCAIADVVSVYNSTAGLEAVARGVPTLVGGAPHFRGRGFTVDIDSPAHYRRVLDSWGTGSPVSAAPGAADLARRWVHLFYLRYHVPMGWTTSPLEPPFALTIKSLAELAPGRNAVLDVVCDSILEGRQPLLPRELAGAHACVP